MKDELEAFIEHNPNPLNEYEFLDKGNLNLMERYLVTKLATINFIYQKYGLAFSSWSPQGDITDLAQALKTNGPLCVAGCFHDSRREKTQVVTGENRIPVSIGTRTVFHFKLSNKQKGDFKAAKQRITQEESEFGLPQYTLLLIGASRIKGKDYVYYLDPHFSISPDAQRECFVMSYERLKEHIISINNPLFIPSMRFDSIRFNTSTNSKTAWAVHGNPTLINNLYSLAPAPRLLIQQQTSLLLQ